MIAKVTEINGNNKAKTGNFWAKKGLMLNAKRLTSFQLFLQYRVT
jgi:hypothetical protein